MIVVSSLQMGTLVAVIFLSMNVWYVGIPLFVATFLLYGYIVDRLTDDESV